MLPQRRTHTHTTAVMNSFIHFECEYESGLIHFSVTLWGFYWSTIGFYQIMIKYLCCICSISNGKFWLLSLWSYIQTFIPLFEIKLLWRTQLQNWFCSCLSEDVVLFASKKTRSWEIIVISVKCCEFFICFTKKDLRDYILVRKISFASIVQDKLLAYSVNSTLQ